MQIANASMAAWSQGRSSGVSMNGRKCSSPLAMSSGQTMQAAHKQATTPAVLVRFHMTPAKNIPANGSIR